MNVYYINNNNNPFIFIEMNDLSKKNNYKKNKYIFVKNFKNFYDVLFSIKKFELIYYEL